VAKQLQSSEANTAQDTTLMNEELHEEVLPIEIPVETAARPTSLSNRLAMLTAHRGHGRGRGRGSTSPQGRKRQPTPLKQAGAGATAAQSQPARTATPQPNIADVATPSLQASNSQSRLDDGLLGVVRAAVQGNQKQKGSADKRGSSEKRVAAVANFGQPSGCEKTQARIWASVEACLSYPQQYGEAHFNLCKEFAATRSQRDAMAVRLEEAEREVAHALNDSKRSERELITTKAELKRTGKRLEEVTHDLEELQRKTTTVIDAKNRAQKEARDLRSQLGSGASGQGKQNSVDRKVAQAWEAAEKMVDTSDNGTPSAAQLRQLEATFVNTLAEIRGAMQRSDGARAGTNGKTLANGQAKPTAASASSPLPGKAKPTSASAPKRASRPPSVSSRPLRVSASAESLGSTTASSSSALEAAQLAAGAQMRLQLARGGGLQETAQAVAPLLAANVAIDATGYGRPNYHTTGTDINRDDIPDALQANVPCAAPVAPHWSWPEEVIDTSAADTTVEVELPDTARGEAPGFFAEGGIDK
jgi:hypothetical protein